MITLICYLNLILSYWPTAHHEHHAHVHLIHHDHPHHTGQFEQTFCESYSPHTHHHHHHHHHENENETTSSEHSHADSSEYIVHHHS